MKHSWSFKRLLFWLRLGIFLLLLFCLWNEQRDADLTFVHHNNNQQVGFHCNMQMVLKNYKKSKCFEFCESMYFAFNNHRLNQKETSFSIYIFFSHFFKSKENLHENYRKKSLSCLIIYAKMIFSLVRQHKNIQKKNTSEES